MNHTIARLLGIVRLVLTLLVACLALVVVVAAVGTTTSSPAPEATGHWATADEIGAFVERRSGELRLAGLAVVILRDGQVFQESYLGTAGEGRPMTADTRFVLGSTSKQFTGLAVQQLITQGRLSLTTRLGQLFPDSHGGARGVTVGQLLSHTSGLTTTVGLEQWGWQFGRSPSISDNALEVTDTHLDRAPGSYEYSNSNYDLLGAIVEQVTGEPFDQAMAHLVTEPLGLHATSAGPTAALDGDVAIGHHSWLELVTRPTGCPCTPGAVPSAFQVSSASDLTRLLRAHMGSVPVDLPAGVLAAGREPLATIDAYARYGSGWVVRPLWELLSSVGDPLAAGVDGSPLPTCVDHLGSTYRSQSYLLACPSTGFGIVALTNTGAGIDTTRWARFQSDLTHVALGTPVAPTAFNPVESCAPMLVPAVVLLQAASLLPLLGGGRLRRRVAVAGSGAVGGVAVWWAYVPMRLGPRLPIASLWAQAPELAIATTVSSALAALAVALVATRSVLRRRRLKH